MVASEVKRIRYIAYQQFPNLYNKVLACPISAFNLLPYAKRKVKEIDLSHHPLPDYILPLKPTLQQELPEFNHLLINVYPPGVGIMPHFDGPLYQPKVVVLSLGGPAIISFTDSYQNKHKASRLLLEDQSLHIFEQDAYEKYLHGIEDFTVDSVFIQVEVDPSDKWAMITRASVDNFNSTRLQKIVTERLRENGSLECELDLSSEAGFPCCLIPIKLNADYNYKIEMVRKERISITIRNKMATDAS